MNQLLLFPDPRPLVERLGVDFFRRAPQSPGVYLMRDAAEEVLYVGKAKNLRNRLNSYRVASPDRMKTRQLKLLRQVVDIQLEEWPDEQAALAREAALLLHLRPRFNRAGTWPRQPQIIAWKVTDRGLSFQLMKETPRYGQFHGPLHGSAASMLISMARLAWRAIHNQADYSRMPEGFGQSRSRTSLSVPRLRAGLELLHETSSKLQAACDGQLNEFRLWLDKRTPQPTHPFELAARNLDLETLKIAAINRTATVSSRTSRSGLKV